MDQAAGVNGRDKRSDDQRRNAIGWQSLGRALDLVDRIAASGKAGARLTDLAREVGLSKAAAYAILVTLRARVTSSISARA